MFDPNTMEKWITVERLMALLPSIPEGSELMVNRIGNINVYEPGKGGAFLGWIDVAKETFEK
jgi:hypothetical protein